MRYPLLGLLIVLSLASFGQSRHDVDSAYYLWAGGLRVNPYVEAHSELSSISGNGVSSTALNWGLLINDRINAGSFISTLDTEVFIPIIFPNGFELRMIQGGGFLGYGIPVTRALTIGGEVRYGFGEMEIRFREVGTPLFSTRFNSLNPSIVVDYQVFRFLKATTALGYRRISDFDLNTISPLDFDAATFRIGLKVGLFKRLKFKELEDEEDK